MKKEKRNIAIVFDMVINYTSLKVPRLQINVVTVCKVIHSVDCCYSTSALWMDVKQIKVF